MRPSGSRSESPRLLGRSPAGDADELIEGRREEVVRMATRRPHLVVMPEIDVDDRPDRRRVAKGSDAARGSCNPSRGAL